MKIAVVIPKYGLLGGSEGFAFEVTERLAARGELEVHVFSNRWRSCSAQIVFHKVPLMPVPRFLRPISFAYLAKKMIGTGNYDIIHAHERIFNMDLFSMHSIPHKTWIKEVREKPLSLFDRATAWVERKAMTGLNIPVVLPVSTLVKDELQRAYDVPESKIHVVHPGISLDRFAALNQDTCRREIRKRYNLLPSDTVILFVGMNFEIKRLDLILRAMAASVNKGLENTRLRLLAVGKGDQDRYLTLAHSLGIGDRVIFVGSTSEIEQYYLACDIFAMPSRFDTFGMAVLEAMVARLPVIITQRVGARDIVESGVHGFILSEKPSPEDMAKKLKILTDKEERLKMGERAHQVALQYTWDKTVMRVEELYHHLGCRKRARPSLHN